ncbi:unnamed protein product [Trichobilharzia szidati]|nr:unnamed protein product [Trichobilharzia szidati]
MFNSQWTLSEVSLLAVAINPLQLFSLLSALLLSLLFLLVLSLLIVFHCFNHSYYYYYYYYYYHLYTQTFSHFSYLPQSLSLSSLALSSAWISSLSIHPIFIVFWRLIVHVHRELIICIVNLLRSTYLKVAATVFNDVYTNSYNLVLSCVKVWNLDSKLLTILLSNHGNNDTTNIKSVNNNNSTAKTQTYTTYFSHGMNKLFILYLGLLLFHGLIRETIVVNGRPLQDGVERRYGELNLRPSKSLSSSSSSSSQKIPKVVMPPYDLGFRGQKTEDMNKVRSPPLSSSSSLNDANGKFDNMRGFQSDETYDGNAQSYFLSPSASASLYQGRRNPRYQRVNRDNFKKQTNNNFNGDNTNDGGSGVLGGQLYFDAKIPIDNQNPRSYRQPRPQSPISVSSIKEMNDPSDYRRVNLAPSQPFPSPIQQQPLRPSYSSYNPRRSMNSFHDPLFMSEQETNYDGNDAQFSQQDNQWGKIGNPYQRQSMYDANTAYMNRENPSVWYPVSYQNLNDQLENPSQYENHQQIQQPSGINAYPPFNIPNNKVVGQNVNPNANANANYGRINANSDQLSYFREIPDIQLSYLINQYQMELSRRRNERGYYQGNPYYSQPLDPEPIYPPGYYPQDHGLHLSGSKSHDKVIQRFNSLASQRLVAGIDEFFDEIDHNRNGVITPDELRNYLLLHEVHFAR